MLNIGDIPKVRILVVGDSGTGKTSLVHKLCHGIPLLTPRWTVGCALDMMFFDYIPSTPPTQNTPSRHHNTVKTTPKPSASINASTAAGRRFFIEFFDVGGHRKYEHSRNVFYTQVNGIILTFDLTNSKSYKNLRKWIRELVCCSFKKQNQTKLNSYPLCFFYIRYMLFSHSLSLSLSF